MKFMNQKSGFYPLPLVSTKTLPALTGLLAVIIVTAAAVPSNAGYKNLKERADSYTAPAYFVEKTESIDARAMTPLEKEPGKTGKNTPDFSLPRDILENKNTYGFLSDNDKRMQVYKDAASSKEKTLEILENGLNLEMLQNLALVRNPGIQSGFHKAEAAREAFTQVRNTEEILRQYTAFTESIMTGVGPMKGVEPVRTKFPSPGVSALKSRAVERDVQGALVELEIKKRNVLTDIETIYWDLVYNRKARLITGEMIEYLAGLRQVARARYRAGKTDFQDVIKIDIRLEMLKEKMITLENRKDTIQTDLLSALNLQASSTAGSVRLSEPVQTLPPFSELDRIARQRRQELNLIKTRIDRMTYMVAMGKKMKLPDFSLNLSVYEDRAVNQVTYAATQSPFSEKTRAFRGYGLPERPFSGVENGWLRQTEKNIHALQKKLEQETSDTSKLLKNAWFEFDKAVREKNLYENRVIDLSKSALTVSKKGYEAGRITFADVIGSYTTWLDVNLAFAEKISAIGRTRAKIKRITGVHDLNGVRDEQVQTRKKQDGTK